MTQKPPYIVHEVSEKDITVDWFFGRGHVGTKIAQGVLLAVAWFFAILPVYVTASAIVNKDNPGEGWWHYAEGYILWEETLILLGVFIVLFAIVYLALLIAHMVSRRKRARIATYDEERLAKRLTIAQSMYVEKYGPRALRIEQKNIQIQPYANLEPYELRGLYRSNGVE